jgi:mRNA interferase RelE/StbE
MLVKFRNSFHKDIAKLHGSAINNAVIKTIENIEQAKTLADIKALKKMQGHKSAYRIKVGHYRIGLFIDNNEVEFNRILHRKEIYRFFP